MVTGFSSTLVFPTGQGLSPGLTSVVASQYKGAVLVAVGDMDAVFCNAGPTACPAILNKTAELFPSNSIFATYVAPNTGHTLGLHLSAPSTIAAVNAWIGSLFP